MIVNKSTFAPLQSTGSRSPDALGPPPTLEQVILSLFTQAQT